MWWVNGKELSSRAATSSLVEVVHDTGPRGRDDLGGSRESMPPPSSDIRSVRYATKDFSVIRFSTVAPISVRRLSANRVSGDETGLDS